MKTKKKLSQRYDDIIFVLRLFAFNFSPLYEPNISRSILLLQRTKFDVQQQKLASPFCGGIFLSVLSTPRPSLLFSPFSLRSRFILICKQQITILNES